MIRRAIAAAVVASCIALVHPSTALAWGEDGHRVVCELAYLLLNDDARARVDALRGQEGDVRVQTVGDLCVWADFRNQQTDQDQLSRRDEHFVNVPRWYANIWYEECPDPDVVYREGEYPARETQRVCLFSAIRREVSALSHDGPTAAARLRALKYLGHWLGDMHQPLHISYADDLGGNAVLLKTPFGSASKLHSVWDTAIPVYLMGKEGLKKKTNDTATDRANAAKYAALLKAKMDKNVADADVKKWAAAPMIQWANESYEITRNQTVRYCVLKDSATHPVCWYSDDEFKFDREDDDNTKVSVDDAYVKEHGPTVERRLQQAGVRLANILNNVPWPQVVK